MRKPAAAEPSTPWLALAISSLCTAGAFALFLVVARVPPFSTWLASADFFKRCLVIHVDLSIVVWFHAYTAALFGLLPSKRTSARVRGVGFGLAAAGVAMLLACLALPDARPILTNYVPSLDHPLFLAGIGAFFAGTGLGFLDGRLWVVHEDDAAPSPVPPEARPGLRAAAIAFLLALLTFAGSALSLPPGLPVETRNELLFWGGGHMLQVVSVATMLSVWLMLLTPALGRAPMSRRTAAVLFALLVLPAFGAPLLAASGAANTAVHDGFTQLMRWGIFPVVTVFAVLCLRAVRKADCTRGPVLAFLASVLLTAVGFVLGAMIRGSTTMVPAHYHASIGAVTVSLMAITYPLFEAYGLPQPSAFFRRVQRWQPLVFGAGQTVFAAGFALAGAHGMARKTYAGEQHIRTAAETLGLVVMGVGGLVAIAGGLLFLGWVFAARWTRTPSTPGRTAWQSIESLTPFRR